MMRKRTLQRVLEKKSGDNFFLILLLKLWRWHSISSKSHGNSRVQRICLILAVAHISLLEWCTMAFLFPFFPLSFYFLFFFTQLYQKNGYFSQQIDHTAQSNLPKTRGQVLTRIIYYDTRPPLRPWFKVPFFLTHILSMQGRIERQRLRWWQYTGIHSQRKKYNSSIAAWCQPIFGDSWFAWNTVKYSLLNNACALALIALC